MTPIYHANQMLVITGSSNIPSRPVINVMWDEIWNCYTYLFPLSLIMEIESHLEPTGEPDTNPDEWISKWKQDRNH